MASKSTYSSHNTVGKTTGPQWTILNTELYGNSVTINFTCIVSIHLKYKDYGLEPIKLSLCQATPFAF